MRYGIPLKAPLTDTIDSRYDFRNLVVCNADGSPRGGITSFNGPSLLVGTSSMQTSVRQFSAVAVRDGGVVLLANEIIATVTHDAAPTSNSRIDLIYAKQNDSSSTVAIPDADNSPVIGIVKGTAASLPSPPALPDGAVSLGSVQIAAGVTATNAAVISQPTQFTAGAGGVVPFPTKSQLDLWTTASPNQHATVFADTITALSTDYVWNGSAWEFLTPIQSAGVVGVAMAASANGFTAVTFPPGEFTVPPVVTVSLQGAASGSQKLIARAFSISTTGFQLYCYTGDGLVTTIAAGANPVGWHAVQMTPTTAAG